MCALEINCVLGPVLQYLAIVAKDTKNGGCKLPCDIAPVLSDNAAGTLVGPLQCSHGYRICCQTSHSAATTAYNYTYQRLHSLKILTRLWGQSKPSLSYGDVRIVYRRCKGRSGRCFSESDQRCKCVTGASRHILHAPSSFCHLMRSGEGAWVAHQHQPYMLRNSLLQFADHNQQTVDAGAVLTLSLVSSGGEHGLSADQRS